VDEDISATIRKLVSQEHELRTREAQSHQAELDRLATLEVQLDQCWDLLRQRCGGGEGVGGVWFYVVVRVMDWVGGVMCLVVDSFWGVG
jgi:hypothetical protein